MVETSFLRESTVTKRTLLLLLALTVLPILTTPPRALAADAAQDGPRPAPAQDPPTANRLVNVDTAATADKGTLDGSLDFRFLDNREDITFATLNLRYGITPRLEAGVRAVTGET